MSFNCLCQPETRKKLVIKCRKLYPTLDYNMPSLLYLMGECKRWPPLSASGLGKIYSALRTIPSITVLPKPFEPMNCCHHLEFSSTGNNGAFTLPLGFPYQLWNICYGFPHSKFILNSFQYLEVRTVQDF